MIKKFKSLLSLGIHNDLTKNEEKLVRLLNYICVTWYSIIIFFGISDYFFEVNYLSILAGHVIQFFLLMNVQYLQYKQKYKAARILFVSASYMQFFIFCNFILPGNLIEFFYILIPLFSLLFLNDKKFHYFFLLLVIVSFTVPRYCVDIYDNKIFATPTTMPILFIAIFLLVNYFKNLNIKSEERLKNQRNEVFKDKQIIEEQKKELEEVNRFQQQFFVNVAHEIRTPLTIIKGNTSKILKQKESEYEAFKKELFTIEKQTAKIQNIVNDVMDLTRLDAENFNLNTSPNLASQLVYSTFQSFTSLFENKSISFSFEDHTNSTILINMDLVFIERALNNILINALKYTDEGGKVSIELHQQIDNLIISIQDDGIGICKEDLDKIFNRFYQADNSINRAGGSGIGLSFSKEIIALHQGNIEVVSQLETGSSFIITLPIAGTQEIEAIEQTENKSSSTNQKHESFNSLKTTILLVEDNKDMSLYIKDLLNDFNIIEAQNGIEALELLKLHKIDLILSDYMMPKMNGYELVSELRKLQTDIPIIILTARADLDAKINILRLGIDDYITKPFENEELILRIENSLKNHSLKKEFIVEEKILASCLENDHFILELKNYITENCTDISFGLPEICDHFALSTSSLFRKVKAASGLSPKEFIVEVKLHLARTIIETNPPSSLKELAFQLGYVNYSHFGKLYLKRFGVELK